MPLESYVIDVWIAFDRYETREDAIKQMEHATELGHINDILYDNIHNLKIDEGLKDLFELALDQLLNIADYSARRRFKKILGPVGLPLHINILSDRNKSNKLFRLVITNINYYFIYSLRITTLLKQSGLLCGVIPFSFDNQ